MKSLRGHLLVAAPHLLDPNFFKTVVLIIQHDSDGAFGLVVNRPSDKSISELWEQIGQSACDNEQPVYIGGPVMGPLMALHTDESLSELEVVPGVYFTAASAKLDQLVTRKDIDLALFLGYAGWAKGQLESELATGSWYAAPATREHLLSRQNDLWRRVLAEVGQNLLSRSLHIKRAPDDPSVN